METKQKHFTTSFVLVGTPPIPEVSQQISIVEEGKSLNITCSVSGGERHNISWFKNKEPLSQNLIFSSAYRSVLMLNNVSKSDAGDYECRAADFGDGYWLKTVTVILKGTYLPLTIYVNLPSHSSLTPLIYYQHRRRRHHKNCNFLDCDWFKKNSSFPLPPLSKLLTDSLLSESSLSHSPLSDSLLLDSLLSDSSISQSHLKF